MRRKATHTMICLCQWLCKLRFTLRDATGRSLFEDMRFKCPRFFTFSIVFTMDYSDVSVNVISEFRNHRGKEKVISVSLLPLGNLILYHSSQLSYHIRLPILSSLSFSLHHPQFSSSKSEKSFGDINNTEQKKAPTRFVFRTTAQDSTCTVISHHSIPQTSPPTALLSFSHFFSSSFFCRPTRSFSKDPP